MSNKNTDNKSDHFVQGTLWGANLSNSNGVREINELAGVEFTQLQQPGEDYENSSNHFIIFKYSEPNEALEKPQEYGGLIPIEIDAINSFRLCADVRKGKIPGRKLYMQH